MKGVQLMISDYKLFDRCPYCLSTGIDLLSSESKSEKMKCPSCSKEFDVVFNSDGRITNLLGSNNTSPSYFWKDLVALINLGVVVEFTSPLKVAFGSDGKVYVFLSEELGVFSEYFGCNRKGIKTFVKDGFLFADGIDYTLREFNLSLNDLGLYVDNRIVDLSEDVVII